MRSRHLLLVLLTNDSYALQSYIIRRPRSAGTIALPAYRERRTNNNNNNNISSEILSAEAQKLISAEETARAKRMGQAKHRIEALARTENRISLLEGLDYSSLTKAEQSELAGLLKVRENFEEQYDSSTFSDEHVEFKRLHNEAFVALARYCQREKRRDDDATAYEKNDSPNVFYLDGPDVATSSLLINKHGFNPSSCYVANRHISTCHILQKILPAENVAHATAAEALSPSPNSDETNNNIDHVSFSDVDFSAYYFDGCGGFTPHIIGMMTAALIRPKQQQQQMIQQQQAPIAIGYSLMGGNKDVVGKELDISRALTALASTRGMRTRHVLDDPARYGIPSSISKTEGGTFTSWMLLEAE